MKLHRNAWVYFTVLILGLTLLYWQMHARVRDARDERGVAAERMEIHDFDLTTCLIDRALIVESGAARDGLATLDYPDYLDAAGLDSLNAEGRSPFLLPRDLVLGLAFGGEARAYPLSILNWHELVNDRLGGREFLLSWHPLSGAAAAYERHVDDAEVEFGFSGLLYNSNALVYDRGDSPSLWSQLTGRALSGPAAADSLRLVRLPFDLCRWDAWLERHPETLVLAPDPRGMGRKYRRKPYNSYYGNDLLQYPVEPLPADESMPLKTPVLAVWAGGVRELYSFPRIADRCGDGGVWTTRQGGVELRFHYHDDPPSVILRAEDEAVRAGQGFRFAWFSQGFAFASISP